MTITVPTASLTTTGTDPKVAAKGDLEGMVEDVVQGVVDQLGDAAEADAADFATAAQGAKADTAIQPGNAALTDAREWTASTVSQAEAEAGSATTRRAWTAERIKQAIVAWITANLAVAWAQRFTALAGKATPDDADQLGIIDSEASDAPKKLTWANLKATLKTYFDSLYATAAQGTKADSAIQPGNAALSDAREWTADTVSQADAEAGTATDRRAWSALRVKQAIAAWWAASAAKTALDAATAGVSANATAITALDTRVDHIAISDVTRPGDAPEQFSSVLTGEPEARAAITQGETALDDDLGKVWALPGAGTIAPRRAYALEEDRIYRLRVAYKRLVNSSDPSGDAVQIKLRNLNKNKATVSTVTLHSAENPLIVDGVTTVSVIISKDAEVPGVESEPPATARYCTPFVEAFGDTPTTGVAFFQWEDITDVILGGADVADLRDDLAAETTARSSGDANLQAALDVEATARLNEDAALQGNIDAEEAARAAGDAAIEARSITGAGLATGGGDLGASRTINVPAASDAEAIAGEATDKAMTPTADKAALDARIGPHGAPVDYADVWYYDGVEVVTAQVDAGGRGYALTVDGYLRHKTPIISAGINGLSLSLREDGLYDLSLGETDGILPLAGGQQIDTTRSLYHRGKLVAWALVDANDRAVLVQYADGSIEIAGGKIYETAQQMYDEGYPVISASVDCDGRPFVSELADGSYKIGSDIFRREPQMYLHGVPVRRSHADKDGRSWITEHDDGSVSIAGNLRVSSGESYFFEGKEVVEAYVDLYDRPWIVFFRDGSVRVPGIDLGPDIPGLVAGPTIQCWGDSLTYGRQGGGTVDYPSALAALLGTTVINNGIGSQTSKQISMRQGGNVARVTISGNQIAAGSNTITHIDGVELATSGGMAADGDHPFPLSAAANNSTVTAKVRIQSVLGTLRRTSSGGPPSTSESYTFTPDSGTYLPITCPAQSPMVFDNGEAQDDITILWLGRNDQTEMEQIKANIAACVARLESVGKRYLILSVMNGDYDPVEYGPSGSRYLTTIGLNNDLEDLYPGNFIDIRRRLISEGLSRAGITPTAQDLTDIGNDIPPDSLRVDNVHLSAAGYQVVAEILDEEIRARGWIPSWALAS